MTNILDVTLKYLKWSPVSLVVREVTRINAISNLDSHFGILNVDSILDIGCGDGHWWLNILPDNLKKVHGIDISPKEIKLAQNLIWARCVDVTTEDFLQEIGDKKFDLAIGNCSMEHIYQIDKALINIHEVLKPGGVFVLFVPTPYWAFKGKSVKVLESISPRLSMMFSGMINGFFQHWHLYHYKIWISLLESFKFHQVQAFGLGNSRSEFLFRLFLPTSFVSFLVKKLTGKYLNFYFSFIAPKQISKKAAQVVVSSLDKELRPANASDIFEYILVCKK